MQKPTDTVQTYGHTKTDTRTVGVELRKKAKDLSASETCVKGLLFIYWKTRGKEKTNIGVSV